MSGRAFLFKKPLSSPGTATYALICFAALPFQGDYHWWKYMGIATTAHTVKEEGHEPEALKSAIFIITPVNEPQEISM